MGIHGYNSYLACKNTNKKNPKIYKPGKKKNQITKRNKGKMIFIFHRINQIKEYCRLQTDQFSQYLRK